MKTWLITGASRGLGREFERAALERGDRVVGFARSFEDSLEGRVMHLPVDVADRSAVFAAVARATELWGPFDVVVNNAGSMALGFVEEFDEASARELLDVNFFGALWVTQAVSPVLRRSGGRLLQISSVGGLLAAPTTGLYSAGKFALEGVSEAVAAELAEFGVRVTIVEPGGFWTNLYDDARSPEPLAVYDSARSRMAEQFAGASVDSDPRLAADALLEVVASDDPPARIILGGAVLDAAIATMEQRIIGWRSWERVSRSAEHAIPDPR